MMDGMMEGRKNGQKAEWMGGGRERAVDVKNYGWIKEGGKGGMGGWI